MKISRSQFRDIIREFLEGDVHPEEDQYAPPETPERVLGHGGSAKMAKQQLFDLARRAQSLHDQLLDDDELPEWVQSEIAVAADKMSSVSEHMGYKLHRDEAGSLDEIYDSIPDIEPGAMDLALDLPEADELLDEDDLEEASKAGLNDFVSGIDGAFNKATK